MKATSSSRRRSRNTGLGDDGLGGEQPHEIPAPSNYSPSASRFRSQSPCRTAIPAVASTALHAPTRANAVRHGPPLPRIRAPSVHRGLQLQQPPLNLPSGGVRQHGKSPSGGTNYSWHLENSQSSFLPRQRQQQKPQQRQQQKVQGSLSSSWTVRDPLTSAGNAHADLVDGDDGSLQLDASDQRELSQLTASFERTGLLCCYAETSHERALDNTASLSCADSTAAPAQTSGANLAHFSGIAKGIIHSVATVKSHHNAQGDSTFTSQAAGQQHQQMLQPGPLQQLHPQQQEPQQQQTQQHSQQQKVMLRSWPSPPQLHELSNGAVSTRVTERLGRMSSARRSDKIPGVAPSAFGMETTPSGYKDPCGGLQQLVGTLKFGVRFVVVFIVCLFRLLNTSYDSWSSAQFKKAFQDILAGSAYRGGNADTPKLQGTVGRFSAGSAAYSQQQQPHQQQRNVPSSSSRGSANAFSNLGGFQQRESITGRDARKSGFDLVPTCKKTVGETLGLHRPVLKVLSLIMVAGFLLWWLLITTAPEEFVDFDFM